MQGYTHQFSGARKLGWIILGIVIVLFLLSIASTASAFDPAHGPLGQVAPDCGCSITCEKYTNGQKAPVIAAGDPIIWTYVVTAGPEGDIAGIKLRDDQLGAVSCPKSSLAAGQSMSCTANGIAQDLQGATYTNVATVKARHADHEEIRAEATCPDSYTNPPCTPGIRLQQYTNGLDADTVTGPFVKVGNPVIWTFDVYNTGDAPLTDVEVNDNVLGFICTIPEIAVGAYETCRMDGIAQPGQFANVSIATGNACGRTVEDDDPCHYFGYELGIDIEKSCNGADADLPPGPGTNLGLPLDFTYRVTNTGNVELTGIAVVDDHLGAISCPATVLGPRATMTCAAATTPAQAGQYANLGSVSGCASAPLSTCVTDSDPSHCYLDAPNIIMAKSALPWIYRVTNTTTVAPVEDLIDVTLDGQDSPDGPQECGGGPVGPALVPDAYWCYTAVADTRAGYGGPADATARGATSGIDVQSLLGEIPYQNLTIAVTIDGGTPPLTIEAGTSLNWQYVVTNNTAFTVEDLRLWHVSMRKDGTYELVCEQDDLAAGGVMVCPYTATAQAGQVINIGTVVATYSEDILTYSPEQLSADVISQYTGWRPATVRGRVFKDMPPANDVQDPADGSVVGATVRLMQGSVAVAQTTTDTAGSFAFETAPGDYYVEFDGAPWCAQHQSPNICLDSDVDPTGRTGPFTLASAEELRCLDAGQGVLLDHHIYLPFLNQ